MTTQSKHTPGPWGNPKSSIDTRVFALYIDRFGHEQEFMICDTDTDDSDDINSRNTPQEELKANARLIAAAPDLLKACEVAKEFLNSFSSSQIISAETDTFDFDKTCGLLIETLAKAKEGRVL